MNRVFTDPDVAAAERLVGRNRPGSRPSLPSFGPWLQSMAPSWGNPAADRCQPFRGRRLHTTKLFVTLPEFYA
jgi:hypothetical protein